MDVEVNLVLLVLILLETHHTEFLDELAGAGNAVEELDDLLFQIIFGVIIEVFECAAVQEVNQLLDQFNEMRTMMRQVTSGKGPWAQLMRQYGGNIPGMSGMPALSGGSGPARSGGKKTGKAARKEKRKQKARSRGGRR